MAPQPGVPASRCHNQHSARGRRDARTDGRRWESPSRGLKVHCLARKVGAPRLLSIGSPQEASRKLIPLFRDRSNRRGTTLPGTLALSVSARSWEPLTRASL